MPKAIVESDYPYIDEIEQELTRLRTKSRFRRALRGTIGSLLIVAAVAVLAAVLFLPVLRVTGTSMEPNVMDGDILLGVKSGEYATGQVCCFYYNNKVLLKRVVAVAGDTVDVDATGFVYVNGKRLSEPYLIEHDLGVSDVTFPLQVPEGQLFMLGDHRSTSVDSRSSVMGCIDVESVVGRMFLRIWPLTNFGWVQ